VPVPHANAAATAPYSLVSQHDDSFIDSCKQAPVLPSSTLEHFPTCHSHGKVPRSYAAMAVVACGHGTILEVLLRWPCDHSGGAVDVVCCVVLCCAVFVHSSLPPSAIRARLSISPRSSHGATTDTIVVVEQSMKQTHPSRAPVFGSHHRQLPDPPAYHQQSPHERPLWIALFDRGRVSTLDCSSRLQVQYVAAGLFLVVSSSAWFRPTIALNVGLCLMRKRLDLDPWTHKLYLVDGRHNKSSATATS
jgi:hypothetical protein